MDEQQTDLQEVENLFVEPAVAAAGQDVLPEAALGVAPKGAAGSALLPLISAALAAAYWSTQLQGWLHYQALSFPLAAFVPALATTAALVLLAVQNCPLLANFRQFSPIHLNYASLLLGYIYAWWLQLSQPIGVVGTADFHWQLALAILGFALALRLEAALGAPADAETANPTARRLIIAVVSTAAGIALVWGWASHRSFDFAAQQALAVLLGATPLAVSAAPVWNLTAALRVAATRGVRVNNPGAIAALQKVTLVLFANRGVVTTGERQFVGVRLTRRGGMESTDELLAVAAGIEAESDHPVAAAIREEAKRLGIDAVEVKDPMTVPGIGVSGRLSEFRVAAGGPAMLTRQRIDIDVQDLYAADSENSSGRTVTYITRNDVLLGFITTEGEMRQGIARAVEIVGDLNAKTGILTSDAHGVARYLADQLDADEVVPEVLPQSQAAAIEQARQKFGPVAVVALGRQSEGGESSESSYADALAAADVGIALGCDATSEPGHSGGVDIQIESTEPTAASSIIHLSHRAGRQLRQATTVAVLGNAVSFAFSSGLLVSADGFPATALAAILAAATLGLTARIATQVGDAK